MGTLSNPKPTTTQAGSTMLDFSEASWSQMTNIFLYSLMSVDRKMAAGRGGGGRGALDPPFSLIFLKMKIKWRVVFLPLRSVLIG